MICVICRRSRLDRRGGVVCLCFQSIYLTLRANIFWLFMLVRECGLLLHILFACRQVTCDLVDHFDQVSRCGTNALGEEGVDLGSKQQNDGEVVEEKQEDHRETCGPGIAAQKVCHIEWEEYEIGLYGHCCYQRSKPAMADTDVLIGDDQVDRLKQYPRDNHRSNNTDQAVNEALAGHPAYERCPQ